MKKQHKDTERAQVIAYMRRGATREVAALMKVYQSTVIKTKKRREKTSHYKHCGKWAFFGVDRVDC